VGHQASDLVIAISATVKPDFEHVKWILGRRQSRVYATA
jgi:hypothetical protein